MKLWEYLLIMLLIFMLALTSITTLYIIKKQQEQIEQLNKRMLDIETMQSDLIGIKK